MLRGVLSGVEIILGGEEFEKRNRISTFSFAFEIMTDSADPRPTFNMHVHFKVAQVLGELLL